MAITAALVKELREKTGVGMMKCKQALVETDGDVEKAIANLRKAGAAVAAKKLDVRRTKVKFSSPLLELQSLPLKFSVKQSLLLVTKDISLLVSLLQSLLLKEISQIFQHY